MLSRLILLCTSTICFLSITIYSALERFSVLCYDAAKPEKPFTMFGIACFIFYVVFKSLIPADLAKDYLAGAILLGAAPCTAMVFV